MYLKFKEIKSKELFKDYILVLVLTQCGKELVYKGAVQGKEVPAETMRDMELLKKAKKGEISLRILEGDNNEIISLIDNKDLQEIKAELLDDFYLDSFKDTYRKNINKRKRPTELGFPTIDKVIGGMWLGKTYLIGAPSGHAKTIMLINLCKKIAIDLKIKSHYIDLELGRTRLMDRFLGIIAKFNVRKEAGEMDEYKKSILEKALKNKNLENIRVTDVSDRRIYFKELSDKMEQSVKKGIKVFFIDYIQNIFPDTKSDKKTEISEMSYALRLFANKHEATIFMATQLNRGSSVCDIFEFNQDRVSDSIELVRDRDFMINIRKFQSDLEHNKGILECFIAKNREGEQKKFYLKFKEWTGLLEECEEPNDLSDEEAKTIKAPPPPPSSNLTEIPNYFKE